MSPQPDPVETNAERQAHAYADLGWRVLPIKPGHKRPPMTSWQHAATTSHETIANWYGGLYRGFGLGIATGDQSGVWVLDIDPAHGGDDRLAELEHANGKLPDTPTVLTGGGGLHYYFANPPGLDVTTTKNIAGTGIDVRGNGGQVLAPPTIHPNGRYYQWEHDHDPWSIPLADAPDWLLELVVAAPVEPPAPPPSEPVDDSDSIAAWVNQSTSWHAMLQADGWTFSHVDRRTGDTYWTRPGKDKRDGTSAVLHEPDGPLVNFSTEARALCQPWAAVAGGGWAYSRFGYVAATRHDGDRSEAARQARMQRTSERLGAWIDISADVAQVALDGEPQGADELLTRAHLVDWHDLYNRDHVTEDWVVWPLVPRGRAVALFAPAKAGKSTIVLASVAAAAAGRPVFGAWDCKPTPILYMDYEMTEDDLLERVEGLGFTPDQLEHLHYALLPSLPPLDTKEGAQAVLALAQRLGVELVVVDTFGRAVQGDENEADTTRAFYAHTGIALKRAGIAVLRTDHAGKDVAKGQRGSSAKNDDVDMVWKLTKGDNGVKLERTHSRVSWGPSNVDIRRDEDETDGTITYTTRGEVQPTGTFHVVPILDELGVPETASQRAAEAAFRAAGHKATAKAIRAAQSVRQQRFAMSEPVDKARRDDSDAPLATTASADQRRAATHDEKHQVDGASSDSDAVRRTQPSTASGACVPLGDAPTDEPAPDVVESEYW